MREIAKRFGAIQANRGASLEVRAGEVHALVGENGAGKSTLMRILAGLYPPDGGEIVVNGRTVTGWSTADAIDAGVGMVHQHFMLVPPLTVAENIILGRELTRGPFMLDRARAERDVDELSKRTGLLVPAGRRVEELSVGEAQRVEILKTLYRGARILVLDEPTAVLSPLEVEELWQVLRKLRASGDTIILITHKLDEVMEISDSITVMRQGQTVARLRTADTTPADIAKAMVGRDVALPTHAGGAPPAGAEKAALELSGVSVRSARGTIAVNDVSFTVAPGEILGIAGVEGNGQTELIEAIAGLRPIESGRISMGGANPVDLTGKAVEERSHAGLSHIPEDRHQRGLILEYSIAENLILGLHQRFTRNGLLDRERIATNATSQVAAFDIRPPDPALPARALSGGNQQKIVIAREMGRDFTVLLAAQPTRGVDVGAIEFIHAQLRKARAAGKAVLLVSADLTEVLALSDRIAVMYGGRLVSVQSRAEASEESLGAFMTGAHQTSAA
jgi:simple sugar transport system ATP-binding protein